MNEEFQFKIAYVDLSKHKIDVRMTSRRDFDLYLGGRGLGAKILYEEVGRGVDALAPENPVVFVAGTLVGTPVPTAGQLTILSKSPATGFYCKSNTGGGWAKALKRAGWDGVVIRNASEGPVYLDINDSHVSIRTASHLWGKTVRETMQELYREAGAHGLEIAAIGQAGENLVRYANIMTSAYHAAGRCGLGAVLGAKKLKAIAVRGTGSTTVRDPDGLATEAQRILDKISNSVKAGLYLKYGTAATIGYVNKDGLLPVRNFKENSIEYGGNLDGLFLVEKGYMRKGGACSACPLGCHKFSVVKSGKY